MTIPRRFSVPCLSILIALASGVPSPAADPSLSLDALLATYKELGLPLPPKDAKLVRYEAGGGGIVNNKVQPPVYRLAFEIKPATSTKFPVLLRGTHEWQLDWDPKARELKPDPEAVKDLVDGHSDQLVLAIQCHARGWAKLAGHLLEKSQAKPDAPPEKTLVQLAWYFWQSHLTKPKIDRAPAAKRMRDLIRQDKDLDTKQNQALLKSLELALVPSKAKPGSVEALIDALVDYGANTGTLGFFKPEEGYWRLAELGFDAVPELLKHLDDDRLTRGMMRGFNNFRSWNLRVGDVVCDLLEGLAAEELMRGTDAEDVGGGWLRRQQGYRITANAANLWWGKAQKVGEETYLLDHVLPPPAEKGKEGRVSNQLLVLIKAKYPKHIPTLYKKVLDDRPDLSSSELADAVQEGKLPAKEKLDLFLRAAKHADIRHRLQAFHAIKDLDKRQFDTLLLAALEAIPKNVDGKYWLCPEVSVAQLALYSDDARVWPMLEKVAKRSSLGLRMELLDQFGRTRDKQHRPERLGLLAQFLDDDTLRDETSDPKFSGPGAGFPYRKIEVRDFVAIEIARLVGVEVGLDLDRTPEAWAKVRGQVRTALKAELDKAK